MAPKDVMTKLELRKLVKNELLSVSKQELRVQSSSIFESLKNVPEFKSAKAIALYMNMPNLEACTLPIIEECFKTNKRVYLPKCLPYATDTRKKNHLQMLEIPSFDEVLKLHPQGKYKLLEPTVGNDVLHSKDGLDVIIVPGVAFSREKERLGHGAGFYDEFLSTYMHTFGKAPYLIGIGLHQQLVKQIPTEVHDWTLDCILIADKTYK